MVLIADDGVAHAHRIIREPLSHRQRDITVLIDPLQTGEHECHIKAGALPDGGENDRIHRRLAIIQPIEADAGKADAVQEILKPELRIENPAPGDTRDDQRNEYRRHLKLEKIQTRYRGVLLRYLQP